jgi:hypothetical protein
MKVMPDFLGIGAQRAGTTWLWVHLRSHPQIWMPRRKELHFFDRILPAGTSPGAFARLRYAARFVPGRLLGKMVGEVTPAYATLPDDRVGLIASWMPNLRMVYLLRDPVERAWSHATKGFPLWAGYPLEQASDDAVLAFFRQPEVVARGQYVRNLQTWSRYFPAEQILVCVSELVFADPVAHLGRIYAFLGVDPGVPLDPAGLGRRIHRGRSRPPMPAPVRRELEALLYPQREELEAILAMRLPWGR